MLSNYCHPNGCLTNTERAEKGSKFGGILENSHLCTELPISLCPVLTTRTHLPRGVCASTAPHMAKVKSIRELPTLPTSRVTKNCRPSHPPAPPLHDSGFWNPAPETARDPAQISSQADCPALSSRTPPLALLGALSPGPLCSLGRGWWSLSDSVL